MSTSVKRIAGQSFKFGWTYTNSAGHNKYIRKDSIKKAGLFTQFWSFSWTLLLIYLIKAGEYFRKIYIYKFYIINSQLIEIDFTAVLYR